MSDNPNVVTPDEANELMKPIDQNYIRLQFWYKVHRKNGTEYQSFFEDIMERAYLDFQKIKPLGRKGDGGNDGYRPGAGAYYQAFAPIDPSSSESTAVKKMVVDFDKIKSKWNHISEVKSYYFVFNDKGGGTTIVLEEALSKLQDENQSIKFEILTPNKLEKILFGLNSGDLLSLGFDVDETKSVGILRSYMTKVETDLDRELGAEAAKALSNISEIVSELGNDPLQLRFELLEARALLLNEEADSAKLKYESLQKRFPTDPRALISLAQYWLNRSDTEQSNSLLDQAESIDGSHPSLTLMKALRDLRDGKELDPASIDEEAFDKDSQRKSDLYRLYAFSMIQKGDHPNAEHCIERAIHFNPDRLINYDTRLSLIESKLFAKQLDEELSRQEQGKYLTAIIDVEKMAANWGQISPRTKATLLLRKISVAHNLHHKHEINDFAQSVFALVTSCCFDIQIDNQVVALLRSAVMPEGHLEKLLSYLQSAQDCSISDSLANMLIIQLLIYGLLLDKGKMFFESVGHSSSVKLIQSIADKKYDDTWSFLKDDLDFAINVSAAAKQHPELRREIIAKLPDTGDIRKHKLNLLLSYDEKDFDQAFTLLRNMDLSSLVPGECEPILEVAEAKEAWDVMIVIIEKLLTRETDKNTILRLKLQQFHAMFQLGQFAKAHALGESLLLTPEHMTVLDHQTKEDLLGQTITAVLKCNDSKTAVRLLEQFSNIPASFEFIALLESEVYLKSGDAVKALESIVKGIRSLKVPNPEQYGLLFVSLNLIANATDHKPTLLDRVVDNSFVKIANQDRWYYLGNDHELDATKVSSKDDKYAHFVGKRIDEKIIIANRYRSQQDEYVVERILRIEEYIYVQSMHHAHVLTKEHRWDLMEMVEVPTSDDKIDMTHLEMRLREEQSRGNELFDLYCNQVLPLAFLAVGKGGLPGAIATIVNEERGFVRCCAGTPEETTRQISVADRIRQGEPFLMDGTSALVLSETGLLSVISQYLPAMRVPQSVITMMQGVKEKFAPMSGTVGHMTYAQGRVKITPIDKDKLKVAQGRLEDSIALLEQPSENVLAISDAVKIDCISERMVPGELCDACIIAQRDGLLVMSEDYLYLQANEMETKKKAPEYCSSYALVRYLYESNLIKYDEYLEYVAYLTSYRFRFLPITVDNIQKAVFGDGPIAVFRPDRIRLLNFPLTLSQEYGVTFNSAFDLLGRFLMTVLTDDSVTPEIAERVFDELLSSFPSNKDKGTLGAMFLQVAAQTIKESKSDLIVGLRTDKKITHLFKFTSLYGGKRIIRPDSSH